VLCRGQHSLRPRAADIGRHQITHLIQARLTGDKEYQLPAREVLNPHWIRRNIQNGGSGLNRLLKELKALTDTVQLQPSVPYFIAVYPEKAGVALTLKFTGRPGTFTANIKQVKNKIIGRNTGAAFSVSPNFRQRVQPDHFDRAENGKAFITLP